MVAQNQFEITPLMFKLPPYFIFFQVKFISPIQHMSRRYKGRGQHEINFTQTPSNLKSILS